MIRLSYRLLPFTVLAFAFSMLATSAQTLSEASRSRLSTKFPGETIVASCSAMAIGRTLDSFAAVYSSSEEKVRVVAVAKNGDVRDLDVVPAFRGTSFELQCLNAREAKERKKVLGESEAIRDFLKVPAGRGAVCYFTSETETKCWSTDKDGKLIDAGGWQT